MRMMAIAVALVLAGCGNDEGREVASGSFDDGNGGKSDYSVRDGGDGNATVRIDSADGDVTIKSNTGGVDGAALPGGLPLYPGAKIVSNATVSATAGAGAGSMAMLESADPPARLAGFYRAAAAKQGWKVETEVKTGDSAMLGGPTPDGSAFSVMISPGSDGGSSAMLTVGKQ